MRSLKGGGAERVTANIATGLVEAGLKVDLIMVTANGQYLNDLPSGVRVIDLDVQGYRRLGPLNMPTGFQAFRSLIGLCQYLKQYQPQLLLSATHFLNEVAVLAKRMTGVKTRVIVAEHTTLSVEARHSEPRSARFIPLSARLTYPFADGIVAVSRGVAQDLSGHAGLDQRLIHVLYNPVITEQLYEQARQPVSHSWLNNKTVPVLVASGRFVQQKDFSTLLRAFSQVRQRYPARLILLGDGPERDRLEQLASQLSITEVVDFPGFLTNPYAYMARADAFVSSSAWEGLPTVLIEALALSLPVVATNCPSGPAEILGNGQYGDLVSVGDVSALAEAMCRVLSGECRVVPQAHIDQFTSRVAIARYIQFLKQHQVSPQTVEPPPVTELPKIAADVQVMEAS